MEQILLTGVGGQGVITTSIILAEAAVNNGKEVVQSQAYGAEARGGNCEAEVIISDSLICDLKVSKADIIVELSQKAVDKYLGKISENGIFVVDEDLVTNFPENFKVIKVPFKRLSIEKLGSGLFTNIIMLGFLVKYVKSVSLQSIKAAVAKRVPKTTIESNMQALEIGYYINIMPKDIITENSVKDKKEYGKLLYRFKQRDYQIF